jgi:hypothetical protein
MIYPDGYISLADLARELFQKITIDHANSFPFDTCEENMTRSEWAEQNESYGRRVTPYATWLLLNSREVQPKTMLTNGQVTNLSQNLLRNSDDWDEGTFVSAFDGTLGSGSGYEEFTLFEEAAYVPNVEYMRRVIGPFWGLPVLFLRDEIFPSDEVEATTTMFVDHVEVARQIVERFDSDPSLTKAVARREYGQAMKVAEFQATWGMAAAKRPRLSKSGPRGPR